MYNELGARLLDYLKVFCYIEIMSPFFVETRIVDNNPEFIGLTRAMAMVM